MSEAFGVEIESLYSLENLGSWNATSEEARKIMRDPGDIDSEMKSGRPVIGVAPIYRRPFLGIGMPRLAREAK